jgi:hypothetical protein
MSIRSPHYPDRSAIRRALRRARDGVTLDVGEAAVLLAARGDDLDGLLAVAGRMRDAGLGSIPGTAAEILDDEIRWILTKGKLPAAQWIEVVSTAHELGIPSFSARHATRFGGNR